MLNYIKKEESVLEYVSFGTAKKRIILFTGYKSNLNRWNKYFIDELSKEFTVICFNYSGISKSYSKNINKIQDYAKFVVDMLDLKNKDEFYFFGHSMGGYIVRAYLSEKNYPMPKAIFLNNTSAGGSKRVKPSVEVYNNLNLDSDSPEYIKLMLGRYIAPEILENSYLSKVKILVSKDTSNYQEKMIIDFFEHEESYEQKIKIPTCIIHGMNDEVFPIKNAYNILNMCEKESSLNSTRGTHAHIYDYPKYISNIVINFVNNLRFIN